MYVIAQPEGVRRPQLYRVKTSSGKMLGAVPDESFYGPDRQVVELRQRDVIVNLGDNPRYGKVYGVLVEPVIDRFMVRGWGTVYNFSPDLTDDMRTRVQRTLVRARTEVERFYPEGCRQEMTTAVRLHTGRVVGTYRYRSNGTDELTLRPPVAMGARDLLKTIAHELGHGVWHRTMAPEDRARWIRHYGRYVRVDSVSVADLRAVVRGMRQIGSARDYLHDCEPEDQARVHIYLGWLLKVHRLGKSEVQDLIGAGEDPPLPDTHLHRSETDTPVTLYSRSSPDEMFCEALGAAAVGDLKDRGLLRLLGARA